MYDLKLCAIRSNSSEFLRSSAEICTHLSVKVETMRDVSSAMCLFIGGGGWGVSGGGGLGAVCLIHCFHVPPKETSSSVSRYV